MRLDRASLLVVIVIAAMFLALTACGKKKPPFLPEKKIFSRVEQLRAELGNGVVELKGHIAPLQAREKDTSDIIGCRIYHTWYALDNPPCEGCPIEFPDHHDITGEVITGTEFSCQTPVKERKVIHFFEVRLLGRKGAIGPLSDRAKLIVDQS